MANALVVRKSQLPNFQKALRAAQYVRMSTDYQRYSIENQAAVIAAYLLVPTTGTDRNTIRFTEKDRARLGIDRFETSDELVRSVSRRATRPSHVLSTKPARSITKRTAIRSKSKNGRALH
jgi:Zn-dependent peptidase ImmA (M78 family)